MFVFNVFYSAVLLYNSNLLRLCMINSHRVPDIFKIIKNYSLAMIYSVSTCLSSRRANIIMSFIRPKFSLLFFKLHLIRFELRCGKDNS